MWVLTPIGRLVKILTSHTDSRGLSLSLAARSRSEDFNSAMINRGLFVTIGYTLGIGEVAVRYLQSYLIFRDPKKISQRFSENSQKYIYKPFVQGNFIIFYIYSVGSMVYANLWDMLMIRRIKVFEWCVNQTIIRSKRPLVCILLWL